MKGYTYSKRRPFKPLAGEEINLVEASAGRGESFNRIGLAIRNERMALGQPTHAMNLSRRALPGTGHLIVPYKTKACRRLTAALVRCSKSPS